jgi:hypothetical protein
LWDVGYKMEHKGMDVDGLENEGSLPGSTSGHVGAAGTSDAHAMYIADTYRFLHMYAFGKKSMDGCD